MHVSSVDRRRKAEEPHPGVVCIIYGLRRTGKTTLLFQAMSELPLEKTAYLKMNKDNDMADLDHDLSILEAGKFGYVFIDEVTLLKDFIDGASLLSDIYAMTGMKIVLSGTDSLGFVLSMADELYGRTMMIHTTFIAFREYARITGTSDVDLFLREGGVLHNINSNIFPFSDGLNASEYVETSVARNIRHSLECHRSGCRFMHLEDLYDADELTEAINCRPKPVPASAGPRALCQGHLPLWSHHFKDCAVHGTGY